MNAKTTVSSWVATGILVAGYSFASEASGMLRWRNGDELPGRFKGGEAWKVRWESSLFSKDLRIATSVLQEIFFSSETVADPEEFMFRTLTGDLLTADLVGSNERSLTVENRGLGQMEINWEAIYNGQRLKHPNVILDSISEAGWVEYSADQERSLAGLRYRFYSLNREQQSAKELPEITELSESARGVILSEVVNPDFFRQFGSGVVVIEGLLMVPRQRIYSIQVNSNLAFRLTVDGEEVLVRDRRVQEGPETAARTTHRMESGERKVQFAFVQIESVQTSNLQVTMKSPQQELVLLKRNENQVWVRHPEGSLQADQADASLFRAVDWPENFDLELMLSSPEPLRFVVALGVSEEGVPSDESLRLETWGDELVIVQQQLFEPVMTLNEARREVQFRLQYDGESQRASVFDEAGRQLAVLEEIAPIPGNQGIHFRNWGKAITIERLRGLRDQVLATGVERDESRPYVKLVDGSIRYGHLVFDEAETVVVDREGLRQPVELLQIDQIRRPVSRPEVPSGWASLHLKGRSILRGQIAEFGPERLAVRTGGSESLVRCPYAVLSAIKYGEGEAPDEASEIEPDTLRHADGNLHGRLVFEADPLLVGWRPVGMDESLPLGDLTSARVERTGERVRFRNPYDGERFPSWLRLRNGEAIPCRVTSYDEISVGLESPFVRERTVATKWTKAVEFAPALKARLLAQNRLDRQEAEKPAAVPRGNRVRLPDGQIFEFPPHFDQEDRMNIIRQIQAQAGEVEVFRRLGAGPNVRKSSQPEVDRAALERALTVPRFRRETPARHLLVAGNGDLKRGRLLAIGPDTVSFESRFRPVSIEVDLLSALVEVQDSEVAAVPQPDSDSGIGLLWIRLLEGSTLLLEPTGLEDGELQGRSPIYGDVSVPVDGIEEVTIGEFERRRFADIYADWVMRPAREPAF